MVGLTAQWRESTMSTANAVKIQLQAASLRRKVRKMRRRRGLSSDLNKPIEQCRKAFPEPQTALSGFYTQSSTGTLRY